jgi:hypothetical protein
MYLASLIVAVVAIAAMLLVRRRAPEGSYFADGDRAAGVFGVLATGFAVLAGFVVVLAFQSYDTSRSGAEAEARIVAHQFETVQFLPSPARERLSGELVCYARSVVHDEWPRMESGTLGFGPNPWDLALFRSLRTIEPRSASEQAAYSKYLDERSDREDARADRTHGAEGVIPIPLWIVLFLSAGTLFVFMLFFADSGEGPVVQRTMMGAGPRPPAAPGFAPHRTRHRRPPQPTSTEPRAPERPHVRPLDRRPWSRLVSLCEHGATAG